MKLVIVDKNDNEIALKDPSELLPGDINRSSVLWLTNSKGQILISKRSPSMRIGPGKWSYAVSGTVDEGETYESNIFKEIQEELGLTRLHIILGPKLYIEVDRKFFVQIYMAQKDIDISEFKPDPIEVSVIKWVSRRDLINDVKGRPEKYMPSMPIIMENIYQDF